MLIQPPSGPSVTGGTFWRHCSLILLLLSTRGSSSKSSHSCISPFPLLHLFFTAPCCQSPDYEQEKQGWTEAALSWLLPAALESARITVLWSLPPHLAGMNPGLTAHGRCSAPFSKPILCHTVLSWIIHSSVKKMWMWKKDRYQNHDFDWMPRALHDMALIKHFY